MYTEVGGGNGNSMAKLTVMQPLVQEYCNLIVETVWHYILPEHNIQFLF
jgi:hypothetical protein